MKKLKYLAVDASSYEEEYNYRTETFLFKKSHDKIADLKQTVMVIDKGATVFFTKGVTYPRDAFRVWAEDKNISITNRIDLADTFIVDFQDLARRTRVSSWDVLRNVDFTGNSTVIKIAGIEEIVGNKQTFLFDILSRSNPRGIYINTILPQVEAKAIRISKVNDVKHLTIEQLEFLTRVKDPKIIGLKSLSLQIEKSKPEMQRPDYDTIKAYLSSDESYKKLAFRMMTKYNLVKSTFYLDMLYLETNYQPSIPSSVTFEEIRIFTNQRYRDLLRNITGYRSSPSDYIPSVLDLQKIIKYYKTEGKIYSVDRGIIKELVERSFKHLYANIAEDVYFKYSIEGFNPDFIKDDVPQF